jgi:hypothetical protein
MHFSLIFCILNDESDRHVTMVLEKDLVCERKKKYSTQATVNRSIGGKIVVYTLHYSVVHKFERTVGWLIRPAPLASIS